MRFIRKNGRIIPIKDSGAIPMGYDKWVANKTSKDVANYTYKKQSTINASYTKTTSFSSIDPVSPNINVKHTRTIGQAIGSKINGIMNKFKTIDSGKMQSAYMFQKGKDIGNKIGSKVTTGTAKKVFEKQAIKSSSRLKRISNLMAKNKSAKARSSLLALSVIAGAGAYGYFKSKNNEQGGY